MRASFPHLLNERAKLFGSLTRFDLMVLGGLYLLLSQTHVGGILSLGISSLVYFLLKLSQKYLPKGYFQGLGSPGTLKWNYQLGRLS